MKITLDELQAFAAVVDSGSITAAAQQLDLTVSATSRTLGRLEEKLKTTLLRRTTRRLELTEEGRAFLQDARAIIQAVLGIGQSLGIGVTAEGVEDETQQLFLRAFGCHEFQGYLFSRPLPAGDAAAFLEAHAAREAA